MKQLEVMAKLMGNNGDYGHIGASSEFGLELS